MILLTNFTDRRVKIEGSFFRTLAAKLDLVGFVLFGLFLASLGKSPIQFVDIVYRGGFGSSFALGNSLQRAAPLLFAALCVALPARLGLVVIGGEGAIVLGGVAAAAAAQPLQGFPPMLAVPLMALAAAAAGLTTATAVNADLQAEDLGRVLAERDRA